ncbi:hypothetical protein M885DRAFT_516531 [Pelagophyceae sp. CCMP2097]|nr:hypothetical protein M885DRAFT_516531 [Pelagophyceae sp. CCMP2097]
MARCRLEANEAREAVIAALEADFPAFSRVGIVIVDSLAGACVATRVDKFGSPHVECAPEPRDVVWAELEKLPNRFERRLKERAGFSTKAWIFLIWGIIVAAITVGILAGLAEASKVGGPVQTVCALLAPIVEAAIVNFLLEYMADVIRDSMAPKFDSAWTRSRAEYVQQRDYTTFLLLVAFFARLLGGSLYTTISEISKPTQVFALLAAAVPASAYIFLNYIFYRICLDVNGATQVARWAVMRVKLKFLPPANQFSLDRAMDAPPPLLAKVASWDTFVLVVLLTFAPLAPVTALMSCAYFWNADFWERHTVSIVTKPQFNAAGRLWPLYASQALTCQHIALTTQFAVLLLSSNFWAAIATLPVVVYTLKTRHHVKERAEHGAHGSELQGRLRVADAYDVDEARGRVALGDLRSASGVDAQLAWAAPCRPRDASQPAELLGETALDASADVDDDDHDVNERLVANHAWTTRCDDAEFTRMAEAPQQSTEAPEQSKGDDILEAKAQEP